MEATDILKEEHRVIERVLKAMERGAARLAHGQPVRPGFFIDSAEFVKGFADGCHHKKEENVLFRAMVSAGLPRDAGPVGAMLADHELGRGYIRDMRAAAERLAMGDAMARGEVARAALSYTGLLRDHIAKEDGVLFPMAEQVVPAAERARLTEDFEHIEHEETGAGVHEKYLALAEALEREAAG